LVAWVSLDTPGQGSLFGELFVGFGFDQIKNRRVRKVFGKVTKPGEMHGKVGALLKISSSMEGNF